MSLDQSTDLLSPVYPVPADPTRSFEVREAAQRRIEQAGIALRETFETDFVIVDSSTEELLDGSELGPRCSWAPFIGLAAAVARHGGAEFVADEDPVLVLAIVLPETKLSSPVALGLFLSREVGEMVEVAAAAELLGVGAEELFRWAENRPVWPTRMLVRTANLFADKMAGEYRADELESDVDQVTTQLVTTYEEITLLHQLAENLKISRSDDDLAKLAMQWLWDAVPAEGFVAKLNPIDGEENRTREARYDGAVLTYGECPLGDIEIDRLIKQLGQEARGKPVVLNHPRTSSSNWPFPKVRQIILVPLSEGENVFGWLLAMNHRKGHEFGTVEASLMGSVAAILGIHCGNTELYRQQAEFLAGVVRAMTSAIDAKDPYTCGHSDRVARVAVRLADEMGCDAETRDTIYLSGLLHDIGKIGIDDNVLRKPGKLTDAEYEHIKLHPELGYKILRDLKQLDRVLPVVLHHHEAWDGSGYPHKLVGQNIPQLARIVAVADSFDAMSSDRPYRKGMPREKLDQILREGAGQQWDPDVIDAFFRAHKAIHQIAHRDYETPSPVDAEQWI